MREKKKSKMKDESGNDSQSHKCSNILLKPSTLLYEVEFEPVLL